jgi:hypothetical protein
MMNLLSFGFGFVDIRPLAEAAAQRLNPGVNESENHRGKEHR